MKVVRHAMQATLQAPQARDGFDVMDKFPIAKKAPLDTPTIVKQIAVAGFGQDAVSCTLFSGTYSEAINFMMELWEKRARQGFNIEKPCGPNFETGFLGGYSGSRSGGANFAAFILDPAKASQENAPSSLPKRESDDDINVQQRRPIATRSHGGGGSAPQLAAGSEEQIPDGTYTVARPDGHLTLQIKTAKEGPLAGKRIISYLSGPDNSLDFTGCAFFTEKGACMWKRYRDGRLNIDVPAAIRLIAGGPAEAGLLYAMRSSRCCRCGRKLTVPASIHNGMGPECAKR